MRVQNSKLIESSEQNGSGMGGAWVKVSVIAFDRMAPTQRSGRW